MSVLHELEPSFTSTLRDIQRPACANHLTLHSPAMEVFTDFCRQQPQLLEQNTTVEVARELMRRTHTELFLVIDAQETFKGLLSHEDLESEKVMRAIWHTGLRRTEVTVDSVMTPRHHLHAIDFREFQLANLADVLTRMRRDGLSHLIVADLKRPSIRGMVSADAIMRRLRAPATASDRTVSFSDLCRAIAR